MQAPVIQHHRNICPKLWSQTSVFTLCHWSIRNQYSTKGDLRGTFETAAECADLSAKRYYIIYTNSRLSFFFELNQRLFPLPNIMEFLWFVVCSTQTENVFQNIHCWPKVVWPLIALCWWLAISIQVLLHLQTIILVLSQERMIIYIKVMWLHDLDVLGISSCIMQLPRTDCSDSVLYYAVKIFCFS